MKIKRLIPIFIILLITLLYLVGTASVPFHPDESTQIFMSGDIETLFSRPVDLFYSTTPIDAQRQTYRLLDAPLSRWLIGIGRQIAGEPATQVDWNWSQNWQENQAAGALPSPGLLLVARLSVAWLFGLTLFFTYRTGEILNGCVLGWLLVALMSLNALVLLHTRRAMAESALLFAVSWLMYLLAKREANPLLLALPTALAMNAKQTAAGLAVIALIAVWVNAAGLSWPKRLRNVALYAGLIILVTYLLNPVAWMSPLMAARAAVQARNELSARQAATIAAVSPDLLMQSPGQRLAGWLVYAFFSKPAVADVANYIDDTRPAETAYFANPLHNLMRGIGGGMVVFVFSLAGFLLAGIQALRRPALRQSLGLIWIAASASFLSLVFLIPLPFQRYVVVLFPFTNLWIAFLLVHLLQRLTKNREA